MTDLYQEHYNIIFLEMKIVTNALLVAKNHKLSDRVDNLMEKEFLPCLLICMSDNNRHKELKMKLEN